LTHAQESMSRASNETLRDRALMLLEVRAFFQKRGVLEVDCPLLSHKAPIDAYIDLFEVDLGDGKIGYLHSSPEYAMKRLLAEGLGSIYQLCHVFRKGEAGRRHNPEFTLVEWYRPSFSFKKFLDEIAALIFLFLPSRPLEILTYRNAFQKHLNLDYTAASQKNLLEKMDELEIDPKTEEREELLNLLWGCGVEPHLGEKVLTVVTDFPVDQAMLAQTHYVDGEQVAERFEIFYDQMELGNGYHELQNPEEQKQRLEEANEKRLSLGKTALPIDSRFLHSLEKGLPDAYGIALGFDRLMMLRHQIQDIRLVLPFSWAEA
jgi:lysyl-tRNA synthetase class 2